MDLDDNCFYCQKDEELKSRMTLIQKTQFADIYLFLNQSYPGRCVVAFPDKHVRELFELSDVERDGFMAEVSRVASIIQSLFNSDKINYTIYGDTVDHLHFHVVPKYKNHPGWGMPFSRYTEEEFLSATDLQKRVELFQSALGANEFTA